MVVGWPLRGYKGGMGSFPVIAIVGRPNVGKSSLLNALVGRRISIAADVAGVTRDRVSAPLRIGGRYVELVDTGGYGFVDPDALTEHIGRQIEQALSRANLVLFVVDAQEGLTAADEQIAGLLRKKGLSSVLVANKSDTAAADAMLGDFARLGLGMPVGVSAMQHRNLDELAEAIAQRVDLSDAPTDAPAPELLVAIVGKRNAGKSTLVNTIAEIYEGSGERVIVSEVPGTTRDSVDVQFRKDDKRLTVIDTAGVRKKRRMVSDDIAFYSYHRAQRSIRRADVVLLLIEGTVPVSEPDKKLAAYIAGQYKPVILVVNKWDLVLADARRQAEERQMGFSADLLRQEFSEYLNQELRHLDYAPIAFVTASEGRNVQPLLDTAQHLFKQASERVTTGRLNHAAQAVFAERPPGAPGGRRPRIYYATQTDVAPPTIVLFVNNPSFVTESYRRYIVNRFRELLPYAEVPIRLLVRGRGEREGEAGAEPKAKEKSAQRAAASGRRTRGQARKR